jgi:manganese/zinc/iron transport system permease protein
MVDSVLTLWIDPTVRGVMIGTAAIGALAGSVGTFAVIRQQSLQGDAISHAALPGVMLAFLCGSHEPAALIVGAALTGGVAMAVVSVVVRRTALPFDAALAGALSVFFGLGLVLMTYLNHHVPGAASHGLERYLMGQAAIMLVEDIRAILVLGVLVGITLILAWKELKLFSFDRDYTLSLGYNTIWIHWILTTLIVLATVIGIQAVGVVLMSALLVAPAVAARQWTSRLGPMTVTAAVIGAVSGVMGTIVGHWVSEAGHRLPAGPTIVLFATAFVIVSMMFSGPLTAFSMLLSHVIHRHSRPC